MQSEPKTYIIDESVVDACVPDPWSALTGVANEVANIAGASLVAQGTRLEECESDAFVSFAATRRSADAAALCKIRGKAFTP